MNGLTARSAAHLRRRMLADCPPESWVYFIRADGYIKVGFSRDPERRLANLWSSTTRYTRPRDLDITAGRELLATIPGDLSTERRCHSALWDYAAGCEWFIDEPGVHAFIEQAKRGDFTQVTRPGGEWVEPWTPDEISPEVLDAIDGYLTGSAS